MQCGHLDPPLCEHVENVNVECAVQLDGRAFSGGAAQSLEDSRNGRFVPALFGERPFDVIAAELDRREQPDLLNPGRRANARMNSVGCPTRRQHDRCCGGNEPRSESDFRRRAGLGEATGVGFDRRLIDGLLFDRLLIDD